MEYLTPQQVLFIHSRLIAETGGAHGVRDLDLLLSALGRPQATFAGEDLYPSLFEKAAALMDSLIRNHPFVDGNKRIGITAAGLFLLRNGQGLEVDPGEMVRFTLAVAQSQQTVAEIAAWLQANCQSV